MVFVSTMEERTLNNADGTVAIACVQIILTVMMFLIQISLASDGNCDYEYNTEQCGWDGGDCLP
jgi:hypothetical protein